MHQNPHTAPWESEQQEPNNTWTDPGERYHLEWYLWKTLLEQSQYAESGWLSQSQSSRYQHDPLQLHQQQEDQHPWIMDDNQ